MIKWLSTVGTLSVLACHVCAQDQSVDDRWLLAKYDVNGDSVISADEIEHKRQRVFAHMDGDGNGDVSFYEYEALDTRKRQTILQARFKKLDANSDGQLSGQEYASYLGSFERLDQNGDGHVSSHEIANKKQPSSKPKEEADLCLLWVCVRKSYK